MELAAHARFRAWFEDLGVSQSALADKLKCDQSAISFLLSGKRRAGLDLALSIERASARWRKGPIKASEWSGLGATGT